MSDDDPTLISLMIDYLYQMDYDDLLLSRKETRVKDATTEASVPPVPSPEPVEAEPEPVFIPEPAPDPFFQEARDYDPEPVPMFEPPSKKTSKKNKKHDSKVKKSQFLSLPLEDREVGTERLPINASMYALADKYEIPHLKDLAKIKFGQANKQDWKTQSFVHAAGLVCTTTPASDNGLRDIVVNTIAEHLELLDYEEIANLLDSGNGLALSLIKVLVREAAAVKELTSKPWTSVDAFGRQKYSY